MKTGTECTCKDGYIGDGFTCGLAPTEYTSAESSFYVRITNLDTLNFGWHISDIKLKSEAPGCTWTPGAFPAAASTTHRVLTSRTKVYTGKVGKSHYPFATDVWADDPAGAGCPGPDCVASSATAPTMKYWNGNLLDNNPSTEWWSECLNCPPGSTTIEMIFPEDCRGELTLVQAENYATSYSVERGPAKGAGCGMGEDEPRCPPSMTWDVYYCKSDADCPASLPTCYQDGGPGQCGLKCSGPECSPAIYDTGMKLTDTKSKMECGFKNEQIFGEVLMFAGSGDGPGYTGSYANDYKVESACDCHELCIHHLEAGCRSWKFYEGSGIKHCYLQSSIFKAGEGWYGKERETWPGWTSGTPQHRYRKAGYDAAVLSHVTFEKPWLMSFTYAGTSLTLRGTMPHSEDKATDYSGLQRVKLVPSGESCAVKVPKAVSGLSCVQSTKKSMEYGLEKTQKIYTLCGPRPASADRDTVTFENVKVMPTKEATSYDVCYCAFDCFDPSRWQRVPGALETEPAVYTWPTTPSVVMRGEASVELVITRPAFGSYSQADGWDVKLVRDFFTCDEDEKATLFDKTFAHCSGPDVCQWDYKLTLWAADVGRYFVCFKEDASSPWAPIPSSVDGSKFLEIRKEDADHTHPAGIFHNQYFSALAGGIAQELSVAGFKIPIPSKSRLALTKGTECGSLSDYSFTGSVVAAASTDKIAPTFVAADSRPASGEKSSGSQVMSLAFSEPVQIHEDCKGSIVVKADAASAEFPTAKVKTIPCSSDSVVAFGNKISVAWSEEPLPDGNYHLVVETDTLSDLAGNRNTYLDTKLAGFEFEVDASEAHTPYVIRTDPLQDESTTSDEVVIYFSESVTANTGVDLVIKHCGSDHECVADDPVVNVYTVADTSSVTFEKNAMTVKLGPTDKDFARYQLQVTTSAVLDANVTFRATGWTGAAGPMSTYMYEFLRDSSGFSVDKTILLSEGASTADALAFHLELGADTPPGEYAVCFCTEQSDPTLHSLGDGAKTYKYTDNKLCNWENAMGDDASTAASEVGGVTILGLDLPEHKCSTKCDAGCVGPHCYCDGAAEAHPAAYCLPKESCQEACNALSDCGGINMHDTLPHCVFLPKVTSGEVCAAAAAGVVSAMTLGGMTVTQARRMSAEIAAGLSAALGGYAVTIVGFVTMSRRLEGRSLQASFVKVEFEVAIPPGTTAATVLADVTAATTGAAKIAAVLTAIKAEVAASPLADDADFMSALDAM